MSPFIAEILGTFLLILLGNGVCASVTLNKSFAQGADWLFICLGWGLAVFVAVIVAGPYSGAHINPAVTIGLAASGNFEWREVPLFILAQFIGAMAGAVAVWLNFSAHYQATPEPEAKRGTFCTGPAIANFPQNFFNEALATFVLVLVVLSFTDPSVDTPLHGQLQMGLGSVGALPVGLLVVVIGMALGGTTGFAINPARDLGPRIVYSLLPISDKGDSNWRYAWVPVLAPFAGALIAAWLHLAVMP